jgi:hypothetical protein
MSETKFDTYTEPHAENTLLVGEGNRHGELPFGGRPENYTHNEKCKTCKLV